jgi:hypothetical protein
VYDFYRCVIRTIHDFYLREKESSDITKTATSYQKQNTLPVGYKTSSYKVMRQISFKWKKMSKPTKVLLERAYIVNWSYQYLVKMKQLRYGWSEIFYLDESWVDSNLTFRKCWQDESDVGVLVDVNAKNRLIILHEGSINGFFQNAELIYKARNSTVNALKSTILIGHPPPLGLHPCPKYGKQSFGNSQGDFRL